MTILDENCKEASLSPLGKASTYISQYDPSLLFPIPRVGKRQEINVPQILPFFGFDTWNAYEVSWLNFKGKPQNAIVKFEIDCHSTNIIESKSFKLYLNSFNNTKLASKKKLQEILEKDVRNAVDGDVSIKIYELDELLNTKVETFAGTCIDGLDVECNEYVVSPDLLVVDNENKVKEQFYSNLLKSNCLVTGQPDWGSIHISYVGPKIHHESFLKYLVSFRNHNEFHEQCVERIFMDIMSKGVFSKLTVNARYTRRGGLDINPIRSTEKISPVVNIRMARQ